ncbi:LysR family transcriptional regulator [Parasphingopyxis sp. CP4]|jgi:DNA-binding transcriptional LysR family regulator|nr:LysR family transcriptional regulator [Parasphingopyxis sp. CP4]
MANLDWTLLQSLVAVSEHGSFSAAARATNGSQATLSRHISTLEQQLDARLFERAVGGVELTKRGIAVLRHVTEMADAAGRLSLAVEGKDMSISGTVRITASTIVATFVLPKILAALRLEEPEIDIELTASDKTENLLRREADIAVRMYRPTQADVFARKVGDFELGIFAAHSYLARHPAPTTMREILEHAVVGADRNQDIIAGMKRFGVHIEREFFAFRSDDPIVCWNMVVEGYGLGFNQVQVGEAEPRVSRIEMDGEIDPLPVWLVAHSELKTNPRVRRVFDFLADRLSTATR